MALSLPGYPPHPFLETNLQFHARTDIGLRRKHNEDSLLAADEYGLFVVADGVGGRKAGELASAIAVNTFQKAAPKLAESVEVFAKDPTRETRNKVLSMLDLTANLATKSIYEAAEATGRQGMTTTLVACIVGGGSAFIVHVGDSRAYVYRRGELRQLTEDHSMVNQLLRQGTITKEEALDSRYKNVITRAIGLYPSVQADTLCLDLVEGDRVLLCSDGLSDMVSTEEIIECVKVPSISQSTEQLIQAALAGGGRDNVTVIVCEPTSVLKEQEVSAKVRAMETLFLFSELPFHARLRVVRIVSEHTVHAGEKIVQQGGLGNTLYAVVEGEFSVIIDGQEVAVLREGEHFGELGLISNEPRSADIVAKGKGLLMSVQRQALREFCMVEPALGNQIIWKLVATLGQRLRSTNKMLTEHI